MRKKTNKKLIFIISIIVVLILAITIFLLWFYNHENIPKKYRGTWTAHIYSISDGTEKEYNLNIFKDKIHMDSTPRKIEYEIDGDNLIIVYVNQETNERYKQYLLVSNDTIYISDDKKIDNSDLNYCKKGSNAEKEEELRARADYYAYNIAAFANEALKETYHTDDTISILAINDLNDEQKAKKDDLNYYYAFYNAFSNTVEIAINRSTGKLENVTYTENLSTYNTSDVAINRTTAALYGISCLIYTDNYNIKNINNADELDRKTAELYGSVTVSNLLQKVVEEKTYITTYEDDSTSILLSSPIYQTTGKMTVYVSEK